MAIFFKFQGVTNLKIQLIFRGGRGWNPGRHYVDKNNDDDDGDDNDDDDDGDDGNNDSDNDDDDDDDDDEYKMPLSKIKTIVFGIKKYKILVSATIEHTNKGLFKYSTPTQ